MNNFVNKDRSSNILEEGNRQPQDQDQLNQNGFIKRLFSRRLFHKLSILGTEDNYVQYLISLMCNNKKKIEKYEQQFSNIEKIICISTYSKAISSAIYT